MALWTTILRCKICRKQIMGKGEFIKDFGIIHENCKKNLPPEFRDKK